MITHVAYKKQPGVKHIASEFLAESFFYDKTTDTYTCPAGEVLTSLGTWHKKKEKQMKPVTALKPIAPMVVKHAS